MSRRIFVPTTNGPDDWRKLLADPQKHWRSGFSAKALAYCWDNANGFPPEINALFSHSGIPALQNIELLCAFPEHKVVMPPNGGHPSQNDLFLLAKDGNGQLITLMVEGKVAEPFGAALGRWNAKVSRGKTIRLAFLKETLGLSGELPPHLRYQLFHRAASAVIEAKRFNARTAVMVVHSFHPGHLWFDDYQAFLAVFGVQASETGTLYFLTETPGVQLFSGWVCGDEKFLRV